MLAELDKRWGGLSFVGLFLGRHPPLGAKGVLISVISDTLIMQTPCMMRVFEITSRSHATEMFVMDEISERNDPQGSFAHLNTLAEIFKLNTHPQRSSTLKDQLFAASSPPMSFIKDLNELSYTNIIELVRIINF